MQYRRSFLRLILAAPVIPAFAQKPATRYIVSTRYKVEVAHVADYREFVKNTSAKIMSEWLKVNPKLLAWNAFELNYGGSPLAEYNFGSSLTFEGPPPEDLNSSYQLAVKNAGFPYEATQAKARSLRTFVGSQLRRSVASTGPATGDWLVAAYLKAKPGKLAELLEWERSVSLPVVSLMAKDRVISNWSLAEVVFPRGQHFDLVSSVSHESLADAVENGMGRGYSTYFAKAHPGKSYTSYVDFWQGAQTTYRTDLQHRIARVAR